MNASAAAEQPEGLSIGPTVGVFFHTCLHERPVVYCFAWGSSALAVLATLVITCRHAARLRASPICLQRGYYMRIVAFPVVLGVTAFLSLLCPRAWIICHLAQGQFEAITIGTFGIILFMLLAVESRAFVTGQSYCSPCAGASPGQEGEGQPEGDGSPAAEEELGELANGQHCRQAMMITKALRAQGPRKHFGVPPLGCCLRPCLREHDLSALNLLQISWMVKQYAYASVVLSALMMWGAVALRAQVLHKAYNLYRVLVKTSGLVAVYGLMILYLSTRELLHHWHTTAKFMSIKLVVIVFLFQEHSLQLLIEHLHRPSASCLVEPGHESLAHLVNFWNMWFVSVEAVGISLLICRAFPAEEIFDFKGHHLDLVELELEYCYRRERQQAAEASEASEGSEGSGPGASGESGPEA